MPKEQAEQIIDLTQQELNAINRDIEGYNYHDDNDILRDNELFRNEVLDFVLSKEFHKRIIVRSVEKIELSKNGELKINYLFS